MSSLAIILNPAARSERAKKLVEQIYKTCNGAEIFLTECPGDTLLKTQLAVQQGFTDIIAAGGDGTVNEVVNGIGDAPVNLGILPLGTLNVFAAEVGIPSDVTHAWNIIQTHHVREIDFPMANSRRFVQLAGVGLDAQVVEQTAWESKKHLGPLSYFLTLARLATHPCPRIRVRSNQGHDAEGSIVLIGNGQHYAGPFRMFQSASLDDGLLDVCIFKKSDPATLLWYAQSILLGNHTKLADVQYFQATQLEVTAEGTVPIEADGELIDHLPCTFTISPHKLRVIAKK